MGQITEAIAPEANHGTLTVTNNSEHSYTYDLSALLPDLNENREFGSVRYTLGEIDLGDYYTDGADIEDSTLTLPINNVDTTEEGEDIGKITIQIDSNNYQTMTATITVKATDKKAVQITGVSAQNGTYNGQPHTGYTGTPTDAAADGYGGEYEVTYTGRNGTTYANEAPPTDVGEYTVTISVPEDNHDYAGKLELNFEIAQPPSNAASSTPQNSYTTTTASISRTTSRSDLNWLIRNGRTLTLKCGGAEMSFLPEALQAIVDDLPQSGGATFAAAPFKGTLPNGARTAYDFTLTDGGKKPLEVAFPAGSVTIGVAYTPETGEDTRNLYLAYVDGDTLERVSGSAYRSGAVYGDVAHFSTYAVAYEEPVQPWVNPFTDMSEGAWYYDAVQFVHQNGLMNGTSATTFSPGQTTSRAMIATILWRQADSPVVNYAMNFDDVDASAWYGEAVRWAAGEGIVSGYGDGKFGPNDAITREQLAVMLYNYEKKRGGNVSAAADLSRYTDAGQISTWALDALRWAVSEGIITGTSSTTLSPKGQATRAQAAAMLTRFCKRFLL